MGAGRTAVLASGTGTILSALIEADIPIDVVVVDRPCNAEKVAAAAGIPVELVVRSDFGKSFDRERYSKSVLAALEPYNPALVVLAGFGTILSSVFIEHYSGRVLNTHPSLLPAFRGWHAVREALASGVKVTGCTVHVVTADVDEGPILAQEPVRIVVGDTEEELHERIKTVERELYPATVRQLLAEIQEQGV